MEIPQNGIPTIAEWYEQVARIAEDHGRVEVAHVLHAAAIGAFFAIERVGKIMRQADLGHRSKQELDALLAEMDAIDTTIPRTFACMD